MIKESFYTSHDFNARNDEKILVLRAKYGMEGYGLYWALIEMMGEAKGNKLSFDKINGVAMALSYDCNNLVEFVKSLSKKPINLFKLEKDFFWSESLLLRIEMRKTKKKILSDAGKAGALKRWKNKNLDIPPTAPPLQSECESITKKGKEKKGKEKKGKKKEKKSFILPENINKKSWSEFVEFRIKEKKSPMGDLAKTKNANILMGYSSEDQKIIIDKSIAGGWTALYHLDKNNSDIKNNTFATKKRFDDLMKDYLNPINLEDAFQAFQDTVKNETDLEDAHKALKIYNETKEVKDGFIQKANKWMRSWRDWANYIDPKKQQEAARHAEDLRKIREAGIT